jgi:hypothetical protein
MGLRALDIVEWLDIDAKYDAELSQKRDLLLKHRDQVLGSTPAGEQGARETLDMILDFLPQRFPDRYPTRPVVDPAMPPLEAAALLVQEDLVVMSPVDDRWVLSAGCVCFPSRWDLREKLGGDLHSIHEPVPHYAQRIGQATHTMFGKFTAERPVWRLNWSVMDTDELFLPPGPRSPRKPGDFADTTYFRTERQTMRVLPGGDVLFTIRTYVDSLADLDRRFPTFRRDLTATLKTTSDQTRAYKDWPRMWEELMAWGGESPEMPN